MDKILPSLRINEQVASRLSYAVVSLMLVCAMVIAVRFGQALIPAWHGSYLVLLGCLVIWETFYTQRIRKNLIVLSQEWLVFYLAEFVVLLIALKIFQLAAGGIDTVFAQFAAMRQDFVSNFFNLEYLLSLLSLLVIWIICMSYSIPLEVLRVSPRNLQIQEDLGSYPERSAARQQLVDQVLLVGLVMVVMTSLTRSDRTSSWFDAPGTRMDVIIIMVYFLLGLVLLSLTQFSVMQMRWAVIRIPMSRSLATNWTFLGFLFLVVVTIVSLILPTHYTVGLLTLLNMVLGFVMRVI
jgi:hypothetical protein